MTAQIWGCTVASRAASEALGQQNHHLQVRAVVLARSRAAAARAFTAAGLFSDPGSASRFLATYGSTSTNPREVELCTEEGQVWVGHDGAHLGPRDYLPWSP